MNVSQNCVVLSEPSIEPGSPQIDLFEVSVWREPLAKFAQASGLTISLFDRDLKRREGPITAGPIGARLADAGFWRNGGLGCASDLEAARECAARGVPVFSVRLEIFAQLAVPIIIDEAVRGVFVLGWIPVSFADPVNSDIVAKQVGVPQMEIWQLMRMQQPIAREKLETHGHLLETFAAPLLRQLILQEEDRARAQSLKVVSEAALDFAEAATESQICQAAIDAFRKLGLVSSVSIEIYKLHNETEETTNYGKSWLDGDGDDNVALQFANHVTLQIPSEGGRPIGRISLIASQRNLPKELLGDFQLVVRQMGTALQKVHLIHDLESERSALRGANVQLQHLHKMKDEFLATVSHELRTPLNAILGWSELLQDGDVGEEDYKTAISTIVRNARNQSHLIEDLLDVSRIISGKMVLERGDIEATSLLRQSIDTVFPMIEARKQKIHLQISDTALPLKGDATRITQVFWNLLSNASKFTPEGGVISVVLENAGHYFKFEISDSGRGISQDFLPHLFDRFSQADGTYTRRHGGLGLGLAIVRHLVELHGGTVSARSEGEGKGATFTVFLPQNTTDLELDNAQSLTSLGPAEHGAKVKRLKGIKILIVDDEPDALRLSRFVLENSGAIVQMADSAEHGFRILQEWRPDVLISDISMPRESGYEFIRRVRYLERDSGGTIPAIALTALAGSDQQATAINAGFQVHMAKPLEPKQLCESILDLLTDKAVPTALPN